MEENIKFSIITLEKRTTPIRDKISLIILKKI